MKAIWSNFWYKQNNIPSPNYGGGMIQTNKIFRHKRLFNILIILLFLGLFSWQLFIFYLK